MSNTWVECPHDTFLNLSEVTSCYIAPDSTPRPAGEEWTPYPVALFVIRATMRGTPIVSRVSLNSWGTNDPIISEPMELEECRAALRDFMNQIVGPLALPDDINTNR